MVCPESAAKLAARPRDALIALSKYCVPVLQSLVRANVNRRPRWGGVANGPVRKTLSRLCISTRSSARSGNQRNHARSEKPQCARDRYRSERQAELIRGCGGCRRQALHVYGRLNPIGTASGQHSRTASRRTVIRRSKKHAARRQVRKLDAERRRER
jgi:hypothetical protein